MVDERQYKIFCPRCHNWINVSDCIKDGTTISFFADFKLSNGEFTRGRCFASISGLKQRKKVKEEPEPIFKRNEFVEKF